jgi:transitional endoplasmic reticulum ATPase
MAATEAVHLGCADVAGWDAARRVPRRTLAALWAGAALKAVAPTRLRVGGVVADWWLLGGAAATATVLPDHALHLHGVCAARPTSADGWTAAGATWAAAVGTTTTMSGSAEALVQALCRGWWLADHDAARGGGRLLLPAAGVVVTGAVGSGKSALLRAVVAQVPPWVAAEWVDVGATEAGLRTLFARARDRAGAAGVALVVVDDVDAMAPPATRLGVAKGGDEESQSDDDDGAAAASEGWPGWGRWQALLRLLSGAGRARVQVLAATQRPEALPSALTAPGRLEATVAVRLPDAPERAALLAHLLRDSGAGDGAWVPAVAAAMTSCSPADLAQLVRRAVMRAAARRREDGHGHVTVSEADVRAAVADVRPTALAILPGAHWIDARAWLRARGSGGTLVGVDGPLRQLTAVVRTYAPGDAEGSPLRRLGVRPPRGVLLTGPPGTGKTTLAMLAAAATDLRVVALDATAVRTKAVGASERHLQLLFRDVRRAAPCILVIDHLDSLGTSA